MLTAAVCALSTILIPGIMYHTQHSQANHRNSVPTVPAALVTGTARRTNSSNGHERVCQVVVKELLVLLVLLLLLLLPFWPCMGSWVLPSRQEANNASYNVWRF